MNREEFLIRYYLQSRPYGVGDNNLLNLFRSYTDQKIQRPEDINPTVAHFRHLISTMADYLKFPSQACKQRFGDDMHHLFYDFDIFSPHLSTSHKEYLHIVQSLMPTKHGGHLLDVGCGRVAPLTSIQLSESVDNVSAMDKHLLSPETLKKLGVNGIYGYFDKKTDVNNFDFVTGRKPCEAIDSIVEVCSKNNTPYFIQTCSCELPIDQDWKDVLPEIDPNIKFYKDYAFNVDATVEQVRNISDNFYSKLGYSSSFIDIVPENPWIAATATSEPVQE